MKNDNELSSHFPENEKTNSANYPELKPNDSNNDYLQLNEVFDDLYNFANIALAKHPKKANLLRDLTKGIILASYDLNLQKSTFLITQLTTPVFRNIGLELINTSLIDFIQSIKLNKANKSIKSKPPHPNQDKLNTPSNSIDLSHLSKEELINAVRKKRIRMEEIYGNPPMEIKPEFHLSNYMHNYQWEVLLKWLSTEDKACNSDGTSNHKKNTAWFLTLVNRELKIKGFIPHGTIISHADYAKIVNVTFNPKIPATEIRSYQLIRSSKITFSLKSYKHIENKVK